MALTGMPAVSGESEEGLKGTEHGGANVEASKGGMDGFESHRSWVISRQVGVVCGFSLCPARIESL